MAPVADAELDRRLAQELRAHGHRVTLPRLLVHRHVARTPQHVTAEGVHAALAPELPSLAPATIYATLDLLRELGLVRRLSTPGGATVYDSRTDAHHHAICRRCGAIADLDAAVAAGPARRAAGEAGFVVEHTEVQLSGLCAGCAATS